MPISKKDLTEKKGIYTIPGKDGEWVVHDSNEHPTMQMKNIESGDLISFMMGGVECHRAKYVRTLTDEEQIAPAAQEVRIEKQIEMREPSVEELKKLAPGVTLAMLNDGFALLSKVVEKANKADQKVIKDWLEQVADYVEVEEK